MTTLTECAGPLAKATEAAERAKRAEKIVDILTMEGSRVWSRWLEILLCFLLLFFIPPGIEA